MYQFKKKAFVVCFLVCVIVGITNIKDVYAEEIMYDVKDVYIPEGEEQDASKYINEALFKTEADRDKYIKVVIHPQENKQITEYYCPKQIRVYSNTWLYVDDENGTKPIVFNKCHQYAMVTAENRDLESDGYDGFKNIKIEGGIWNGKNAYVGGEYHDDAGFNHFRFAHGVNFEMKNLKVINNNNAHHVQVAGIDGFTVSGCTFEGYDRKSDAYKEAIQIDILSTPEVFGSAEKYDDTPMKNIDIHDNVFKNVDRGVGTHSATIGVYHTNIKIHDNTFINTDDYAIAMMNYKNAVVENNEMSNVEGGIIFMYAKSNFTQFHQPNVLVGKVDPVCNTVIRNNNIVLNSDKDTVGIRSYGMLKNENNKEIMTQSGVGYQDYSVSGITIVNNTIRNAKCDGIGLVGTVKSTVSGNSIYYAYDESVSEENAAGKGIYLKNSNSNTVNNNTVNNDAGCNNLKYNAILYEGSKQNTIKQNIFTNAKWYGIYVNEGSEVVLDSNTIENSRKTGIDVAGKSTANINNNTIKNVKTYRGIYYTESSTGSYINNNKISNVKDYGIYINDSSKVTNILNNTISSALKGIYVYNKANVTNIQKNNISGVKNEGIYIRTYSKCSDVSDNNITSVGTQGIYVDYKCTVKNIINNIINKSGEKGIFVNNRSVVNYIKSNKITSAKSNGIYINNSSITDLVSNVIASSKVTYIYNSKVSNIKSNYISKSSSHGLYIKNSTVTNATSNKLTSNKSNGLYVYKSKVTNICSNTCNSNKNKGIYINKSNIANLKSNKLTSNKSNGLYVYNSIVSTCSSNSLKSNTGHGLYVNKSKMTSLNSNTVSLSKYNGMYIYASSVTNVKSNKVSSSKENGLYVSTKTKVKYLYSNKVSSSKKKAIYIYKSSVSKIKGNSGKIVKKK